MSANTLLSSVDSTCAFAFSIVPVGSRKLALKPLLSAIWKRLIVPPPGHKKKSGLAGPGFLLYRDFRSGDYGAPE